MKLPLITVIVPVYNVEKYISKCVASLIEQTYPNFEIILVDDGSPDGCPAVCDRFASQYDNIRVIHQKNRGLSAARNAGIDAARGELLSFVDSDDFVEPVMLERLYELMDQTGTQIACSGIAVGERIDGVFSAEQALRCFMRELSNLTTCAWGKLYRAALFEDIRFPEGLIFEDFATIPLLVDRAGSIAHTGDILYHYRDDNSESITHARFSPKLMDYFTVAEGVDTFLRESYPELLRDAKNRRTRCAVSFFRRYAEAGTTDKAIGRALVRTTRRGILPYLFSGYNPKSKAFGLLMSVCPPLAAALFRRA